ncbi:MAG: SDR family NAD(P)-dependent oxidoreductase [Acidimicrobiales bacterium]|nr:SDR family NAD(P)-dependent oxidoreductase [Acidimicrobiales bacterium]
MTRRLEGTVALVTGASSGIGEATAVALAGEGAAVAVAARRRDRLEALVERIGSDADVLVIETDVTDEASARAMVEDTVREFGRLDTLVNNAGVMLLGPILDAPVEEWRRMIELNVLGLLYCTHAALPHLLRAADTDPRRVADVVNVSSVAGRVARQGSGVYNASKFGVVAFSESLRQEVTRRHVRVSIVEPGAVMTELASHNRPEIIEGMRATFGDTELMRSEDIAESILFTVTRPRHVAVNEILIRPTEQER